MKYDIAKQEHGMKVFDLFVQKEGLYLTNYGVKCALLQIKKSKHLLSTSELCELIPRLRTYTDPKKGAYKLKVEGEPRLARVRKKVARIHPKSNKRKVYDSLTFAVRDLRLPNPFGHGNVSLAIKYGKLAYGYRWEAA